MSVEIKKKIEDCLQNFSQGSLWKNAITLFTALGYNTNRQNPFSEKTYCFFKESFLDNNTSFSEEKALVSEWKYVDLLFQISEEEAKGIQAGHFDDKEFHSFLFFVIELSKAEYSRTALSQITREINKVFSMPVMVLFKYGQLLTLAVINRRLHKSDESKDVLEKVTLIKDINITNPHRTHIEILFDLSIAELLKVHKFTNFVELHNAWQETLDLKLLNDKFFDELVNWYFWAQQLVEFPNDKKLEKQQNVQINLIRLITRLIFVWFLKEKNLVPENFFEKLSVKELLKSFDPESETNKTYFTAILQNLFFATLNQKMNERVFAEDHHGFYKKDHGIKNEYRYPEQFAITKDEVIKLFKDIPFLNGGLFDCLDKENEETGKVEYIDGFSRNEKKTPFVPDLLFFGKERVIDLSIFYDDKKHNKEKCRGLLEIFNDYKFTIEENTPIEEEIALDPELLGKVFENLLAYYNPETQTTARKQTGSFYTPREIVNYMVDESLKAYLKQKMESNSIFQIEENRKQDAFATLEEKLSDLLSYSENPNPFNEKETQSLIIAIDTCKILDPACGSGAFPMGMLHKLVHILYKLDQKNEQWKELQIQKARQIDDPAIRDHLITDIESAFENNELDYGRKLYLIENCIYGVDIQAIAVQIAKLRFFISLVVDQKKQDDKENFGIRSLPNLETKFVAANTLIGLEKPKAWWEIFKNQEIVGLGIIDLEGKLKELRHRYFSAKTRKEKKACQEKDKTLREEIAILLMNNGWAPESAKQIAAFDLYDQNASSPFFDPEWMFGLKADKQGEGVFDVVIGNPPWIQSKVLLPEDKRHYQSYYKTAIGQYDLFNLFIEKGIGLLTLNGRLTFIIPDRFITNLDYKYVREYLLKNTCLKEITSLGDDIFKNVAIPSAIIHTENLKQKNEAIKCRSYFSSDFSLKNQNDFLQNENFIFKIFGDSNVDLLLKFISEKSDKLVDHLTNARGVEVGKKSKVIEYSFRKGLKKFLIGEDIDRYQIKASVFIDTSYSGVDYKDDSLYQGTKILIRKTGSGIIAVVDDEYRYVIQTIYIFKRNHSSSLTERYVLGCLNSKLMGFWYNYTFGEKDRKTFPHLTQGKVLALPILNAKEKDQKPFIDLVDKILAITKDEDYSENNVKQAQAKEYERQIDQLVYELYGLTNEEIKIVEGLGK